VWSDAPAAANTDRYENDVRPRRKRSTPTFDEYLDEHRTDAAQLKLCLNDFPYYFATGIEHFVLWKLGGEVTPDEITNAKLELLRASQLWATMNDLSPEFKDKHGSEKVINDHRILLSWKNPPHLKSLPGIDHVHILFHSGKKPRS
jgi:hypothetical protein